MVKEGLNMMAAKEDRRVKMTKLMLREALLDMLKTIGIHQISIRELCERADVNRSTFYKYYGSQYDLMAEMELYWTQQIEESLKKSVSSDSLPFLEILTYVERNIEFSRLLVNSNIDPEFAKKLFELPTIKRLIEAGLPIKGEDYAAEYFHAFYVYGGYSIIKHWINKEGRESPEEMSKIMAYLLDLRDFERKDAPALKKEREQQT